MPSATAADVQVFSYGAQVYIRASESSPGQVQVFDISGKQVWQQQVPLQAGLTTVQPQLVSGVYIIKVRTAQRQVTEKIVIQ